MLPLYVIIMISSTKFIRFGGIKMDKHLKERRIFAAIICVMAVALLVMFGVMMSVLLKDGKQDKKPPASEPAVQMSTGVSAQDGIVALELESSWAAYFSQRQDRKNQEAYLDSTLDRAEALVLVID